MMPLLHPFFAFFLISCVALFCVCCCPIYFETYSLCVFLIICCCCSCALHLSVDVSCFSFVFGLLFVVVAVLCCLFSLLILCDAFSSLFVLLAFFFVYVMSARPCLVSSV